jgi:CcmD family protein
MSDIMIVFLVVLIIWLGMAGYFVFIHKNVNRLDQKMDELLEKMKSGTKKD